MYYTDCCGATVVSEFTSYCPQCGNACTNAAMIYEGQHPSFKQAFNVYPELEGKILSPVTIMGKRVTLPGFEDYSFYVHQAIDHFDPISHCPFFIMGSFTVAEVETGAVIQHGAEYPEVAIGNALKRLQQAGRTEFERRMNHKKKQIANGRTD